jgi:hypothetical protein
MKAACSSETLVSTYKPTWHYNPEDQHQHLHCRENLKSDIEKEFSSVCYFWIPINMDIQTFLISEGFNLKCMI